MKLRHRLVNAMQACHVNINGRSWRTKKAIRIETTHTPWWIDEEEEDGGNNTNDSSITKVTHWRTLSGCYWVHFSCSPTSTDQIHTTKVALH